MKILFWFGIKGKAKRAAEGGKRPLGGIGFGGFGGQLMSLPGC